jgi:hypothetical protein
VQTAFLAKKAEVVVVREKNRDEPKQPRRDEFHGLELHSSRGGAGSYLSNRGIPGPSVRGAGMAPIRIVLRLPI